MKEHIKEKIESLGGVIKTFELRELGVTSRQINKMLEKGEIEKIKYGFYELSGMFIKDEIYISRLLPNAVICLESALVYYGYSDRIPTEWQIAVDKDSEKKQYSALDVVIVKPYYIEPKYLKVGVSMIIVDGVHVKIYNRERTICDVLRYEKKMEREVFTNAIRRYVDDDEKNLNILLEYARFFNIEKKVQQYIGVWL